MKEDVTWGLLSHKPSNPEVRNDRSEFKWVKLFQGCFKHQ